MKFETLTYQVPLTDFSVSRASGPSEARSTECRQAARETIASACMTEAMATFLWRLAAYFQGYLFRLPIMKQPEGKHLMIADCAVDETSEPLQLVRLNRHLSRRLRWLVRRGRVESSGNMRQATEDDKARCTLTPGQFNEYCIRVHRWSRIHVYGMGLGRRALRRIVISAKALQGDALSLRRAAMCLAPLMPD